jgi:hypothetical protein
VRAGTTNCRVVMRAALAAFTASAAAGCSGFGGPKSQPTAAAQAANPNVYPANYRSDIAAFLRQSLTDRTDFRGATISQPVLKQFGDNPHYLVCVQFSPRSTIKTKVAVYLDGQLTQFIDATPELCGDATYAPFTELTAAMPAP